MFDFLSSKVGSLFGLECSQTEQSTSLTCRLFLLAVGLNLICKHDVSV